MIPFKKCIAIKSLLLALFLGGGLAQAETVVATVRHLSGALLLQKADGRTRALASQSLIEPGDTLHTQKKSYAQIEFSDASLLTLQPQTTLRIEQFAYNPENSQADQAVFTLMRGGVRVNQGLLGQRNKDRVVLKTPVAEVHLQGSALVQYFAPTEQALAAARRAYLLSSTAALEMDVSPMAPRSDTPAMAGALMLAQVVLPGPGTPGISPVPPVPPTPPGRPPGLYVQVISGLIHVTNPQGSSTFTPGQFGFVPSVTQPPVMLPSNPGLPFLPPPSFSSSPVPAPSSTAKSNSVDCVVR